MIILISIYLKDIQTIKEFEEFLSPYKDEVEVDVLHGRQIIDGYSILGLYSLLGNTVSIEARCASEKRYKEFEEGLTCLCRNINIT